MLIKFKLIFFLLAKCRIFTSSRLLDPTVCMSMSKYLWASGPVFTASGVDETGVSAPELPKGAWQIRFAGLVAKVLPVTLLHTLITISITTVCLFTAHAIIRNKLVSIIAFLPTDFLHHSIPAHAILSHHPLRRLECHQLNGLPTVFIFKVKRPLVLPEGKCIVRLETF